MKNERLKTLEQKYEELGKEIEALKKEEKNKLPMSWEEYCEIYPNEFRTPVSAKLPKGFAVDCPKKYIALRKLELLRDAWGGYSFLDVIDLMSTRYPLRLKNKSGIVFSCNLLNFKTKELRDKFQSTFSDLIEEAKELL